MSDYIPALGEWEVISHVIESPVLEVIPDNDERAGNITVPLNQFPEPLEFLIKEIRLHGLTFKDDNHYFTTDASNLPGYINLMIGSKAYIVDLPIELCMERWHTIGVNLIILSKQNWAASYSAFKWCSLVPGKPITSHGRFLIYLKGLLYRPTS